MPEGLSRFAFILSLLSLSRRVPQGAAVFNLSVYHHSIIKKITKEKNMNTESASTRSGKFGYILLMIPGIAGLINTAIALPVFAQKNLNSTVEDSSATRPPQEIVTIADLSESPGPGYLPTTNGEWILEDAEISEKPSSSISSMTVSPTGGRKIFYLTHNDYYPNQALTACGAGYHMASLWEILNVTNLVYEYDNPAAYTKTDSGYGPPSNWYGWVRTGYDSSGSSTTGRGNCLNWTSNDAANYGVCVRLSSSWETAPGDIFTWDATSFTCNLVGPVWCVRD
ncbi:MAG: hypothetical protein ACYDBT_03760 [Desulfobulbaceae bacterium]